MCIIAAKPANVEMPNRETIENMWYRNSNGAGLMYVKNGSVVIEKGFMKLKDFENRLNSLESEIDLKETPVVLHFRITTHGGTKPENCHPFPVSDSVGILSKLRITTKLGVAHNGIIDITPRKGISDTMEYIISQLHPLWKAMPKFYTNKWAMKMVANAIDSKMAFLTKDGEIYTIGEFNEKDGILYSNKSYEGFKHYNDYIYGYYGTNKVYGWSRELDDEYNMKDASYDCCGYEQIKEVMILDEMEDYHIEIEGDKIFGDYCIDSQGNVYEWENAWECWIHVEGAVAKDRNDREVKFDEDSEWISKEFILR